LRFFLLCGCPRFTALAPFFQLLVPLLAPAADLALLSNHLVATWALRDVLWRSTLQVAPVIEGPSEAGRAGA
jgi:hypothetical protein